jgi:hypothetical protein
MTKVIDVDKVQEALDRAARNAKRGSSEVRAGRLVYRISKDGRIVGANRGLAASALPAKKKK